MINILIVNTNRFLTDSLDFVLSEEQDFHIAGSTTSCHEAMKFLEHHKVDVVLITADLECEQMLELSKQARSLDKPVNFMIMGISELPELVLPLVEIGVSGFVSEDSTVAQLKETIRNIYKGSVQLSPQVTAAMINRLAQMTKHISNYDFDYGFNEALTPREKEILELLCSDLSNKEIAQQLIISVGTVKNHVHNILNKLNLPTRKAAAQQFALLSYSSRERREPYH